MNHHYHHHQQQQQQKSCSPRMLKVVMGMMGLCLAGYIVGPPLYWHISDTLATAVDHHSSNCPPCLCNCSSDHSFFSLSQGLNNTFFTDCMKQDPEVSREVEMNFTKLLTEELKTKEAEELENQQRADMGLLEAKKMASQYQKEADKCNSGMGTCEEAREKAEALLQAQKEVSAIWELRARHKGWRSGTINTRPRARRVRRTRRRNVDNM
ncbi:hypothetical protein LguiA_015153 [Lonicera macranthoides]